MTEKILEQTWWDNDIKNRTEEFYSWVGDKHAISKVYFRNFLKTNNFNFKKMLDVGCGPATEYFSFKEENIDIEYTGVDSSKYLNEINIKKNIKMILAPAHQIPVEDSCYDLVYSRHLLEHQPDFKPITRELIRCTSNLAMHIFFTKPKDVQIINFDEKENLYHNTFKKEDIENFLKNNKKIKNFEWRDINENENILLMWVK